MFGKKSKNSLSLMDIESHESKTKLDVRKEKKKKELGPQTAGILKFFKILIWSILAFVMLIGVVQILKSKQPKVVKNIVEYNISPVEGDTAKAFAVSFVREYLTYDNTRQDDYRGRIEPFMSEAVRSTTKVEVSKGTSSVLNAIAWKTDKLNKDHSNIVVRAEIEQVNNVDKTKVMDETGNFVEKPKVTKKVVYVNVPIGYYDGGFLVEDYPAFTAVPKKPQDPQPAPFKGTNAELDDVKSEIKEVLNNFFKTYAAGNEGQIAYYMDNNNMIRGFEGKCTFEGIQTLEAFKGENNSSIAVVQVLMKDVDLGTEFYQRYILKIRKGDQNRWYIMEFNSRGNIYKEEGGQ